MKNIYLIIALSLLLNSNSLFSINKTSKEIQFKNESFKRLMLNAQPLPEYKNNEIYEKVPLVPLSTNENSVFINVNLTKNGWSGTEQMQNESSIAVNILDNQNLISSAVDYRDNGATWVYVSSNGGKSWINKNLGRPFTGWRASNDPSVAYSDNGIAYLVVGGFPNMQSQGGITFGENGVFLLKSTDKGINWSKHIPVILHKGTMTIDSTFEDKYYIQVDNSSTSPYKDHLYIPWKRVTPRDSATQIVLAKSTDFGETWQNPVNVSNRISGSSEDTTFGQSFPLCITGENGQVYVIWNHGLEHAVGFAKSLDGGKTFTSPKLIQKYNIFGITTLIKDQGYRHTVKGKVRAESYPTMVCDITNGPRRGNLYLVWAADNIPNVYFSASTDQGETWSKAKIIHSDTTNDQFWPWISLDRTTGNIAVMYLDSRLDKSNILIDCFVSFSSDGGNTWLDRRASDVSSDLRNNPFSYQAFAGDYSGCAFHNGVIYPSWVDMRFAQKNTFDNDVYTAVININKPMPVDTIYSELYPEDNRYVNIKWKYDNPQRAFGQKFASQDDYKFNFYRDSVLLASLNSNIFSFKDVNLVPHKKYEYKVIVVANQDSSVEKIVNTAPGGSKYPSSATILSNKGSDDLKVTLFVKLPSKRDDNTTPLTNLGNIKLYRDSVYIKDLQLNKTDTGKTIEIIDIPAEKGFYSYYTIIADNESTPNYSIGSNEITLFTGKIEEVHQDDFDSLKQNKYHNIGGWGVIKSYSYSSPNCITESPGDKYQSSKVYILSIFPVINKSNIQLDFNHVAALHQSDSAIVEYSINNSNNWKKAANYNKNSYPGWADGLLDKDDWKKESINIRASGTDTLYVRFRLYSNIISVDDGWYIDDIKMTNTIVGVNEFSQNPVEVFPNPCRNLINVYVNNENLRSIELFNIFGEKLISKSTFENSNKYFISAENLPSGIYFLKTEIGNQVHFTKIIKE